MCWVGEEDEEDGNAADGEEDEPRNMKVVMRLWCCILGPETGCC